MTLPPLTRICFHRDYDGVVGAAMVLASSSGVELLSPVQYQAGVRWRDQDIGQATAVVDFPFHPRARVWIDHHDTAFATEADRKLFQSSDLLVFNPDAPSCPAAIAPLPWFHMKPHWEEYVEWANIIDSAQYASAQSASDLSNPHVLLSHVITELRDDSLLADLVRQIPESDARGVLDARAAAPTRDRVLRDDQTIRGELRARLQVENSVAVLDQSDLAIPYRRYLAFEVCPAVQYGIGLYRNGTQVIVSVGENPWAPRGTVHLGRLCSQFGGGGRKSVAGVPTPSPDRAREVAASLSHRLNAELRDAQRKVAAG